MTRVLIAGCGDVGSHAGSLLATMGHDVTGLRRSPDRLPSEIRGLAADLTDPSTLDLPEVDLLAYTASADGRTEEAYRAAYVDGLRNVLAALPTPPHRLVFVSSTAVYGQDDGTWVDEDSPTEPTGFSGRTLLEAEDVVRSAGGVVLRLSGIYGPGRTRLIDQVRGGEAVCVEGAASYTNRIHRDDCGAAVAHLLTLDEPAGVYLGTDDEPADRCEVYRWLADQLGVAPPPLVPPDQAPQRSRGGNKRCRNARLRATGWAPSYRSYRDGYAAMLAR